MQVNDLLTLVEERASYLRQMIDNIPKKTKNAGLKDGRLRMEGRYDEALWILAIWKELQEKAMEKASMNINVWPDEEDM